MTKSLRKNIHPFTSHLATLLGYGFYLVSNLAFMLLSPPFMFLFIWNPPLQYRVASKVYRAYCHFLTHVYLPALHIYRIIEESGFEHSTPEAPVIFIANHRSRIDGPMLIPLLPATGILIKSSYARFPLYRAMVRYLDFISVNPHSILSLADTMQQCKNLLAKNKRLLIFPEGTRSRSARLNSFKELAFRLSIETGTAVVPVIIHSELPFMAKIKGSYFPGREFAVVIRALAPQYGRDGERTSDFADRIRRIMAETLRQLDRGTVWENLPAPQNNEHRRHRSVPASLSIKPSYGSDSCVQEKPL
ncbi:MAG: 1-acyl-sn-glycerol-3-phosphate acyltransferase [Chitinispirillaceae bacterium]|nr:1-acyl-sn-glycerol-3-phosphate acyltransferase [Chitinispirillaceae bacterium]